MKNLRLAFWIVYEPIDEANYLFPRKDRRQRQLGMCSILLRLWRFVCQFYSTHAHADAAVVGSDVVSYCASQLVYIHSVYFWGFPLCAVGIVYV